MWAPTVGLKLQREMPTDVLQCDAQLTLCKLNVSMYIYMHRYTCMLDSMYVDIVMGEFHFVSGIEIFNTGNVSISMHSKTNLNR